MNTCMKILIVVADKADCEHQYGQNQKIYPQLSYWIAPNSWQRIEHTAIVHHKYNQEKNNYQHWRNISPHTKRERSAVGRHPNIGKHYQTKNGRYER